MAAIPGSGKLELYISADAREFAARHYAESKGERFGIDIEGLARILAEVQSVSGGAVGELGSERFLASLRLEELVLARACAAGNNLAWELFLTLYRTTLYETAYKVAREESAARALADSLYAELYGVNVKGEQRPSKLCHYHGRGSLQGWLRTVVAQEYVNQYRRTRRETSLETAVEDGAQFEAAQPVQTLADPRVEAATQAELAALDPEERFLLAAYYLDGRTLAEIAKLLCVHESTISRKLDRAATGLRKHIRKRLVQAGMSPRQADEAMQEVDVRDLQIPVSATLQQETPAAAFYKKKSGGQG